MSERCAERVADGWHFRHCSRKAIKDGYCKQHHPDSVKARQDKADARYEEQRANSIYTKYDKALKRIAELEQQVRWIDTKFISNNSVPVDRVVITRAEWEGLCR